MTTALLEKNELDNEVLERLRSEYAAQGKVVNVKIKSLDDLPRIDAALNIRSYLVHNGERGIARKYGISKTVALKFIKEGWLELDIGRRPSGAGEYDLYCASWIPAARAQVMAENGGCGYGTHYEYDGDSSKVERYIYNYGTAEQEELMETLIKRIMSNESLPFMIYHRLALCMLKKYDNAWFEKHWGKSHDRGYGTEALDSWVDVSPMDHTKAQAIYEEFLAACKQAADEYIAMHPSDGGYCGFGWIHVPCSDAFGKWLIRQKQENEEFRGYNSGAYYTLMANVPARQSLDYDEHVYRAGMVVLRNHGIKHTPYFRAD